MPITITPGQAFLLLIQYAQTHLHDPAEKKRKIDLLMQLYLQGAKNAPSKTMEYLNKCKSESLPKYHISRDYDVIDKDPTRRYFETHLAFESLLRTIRDVQLTDLTEHYNSIATRLPASRVNRLIYSLSNERKQKHTTSIFADAYQKISSQNYFIPFNVDDREKLKLLIKIVIMSFELEDARQLPIDIYGRGIFSKENRGRARKGNSECKHTTQETTRSQNYGVLRSYMPVPLGDIAISSEKFSYLRVADRNAFRETSAWAKFNFNALIHPFSSSISGVLLIQMKIMKFFQLRNILRFNNAAKLGNYIKCFTSLLLYCNGGHTLFEFLSVLNLNEVQDAFRFMPDFNTLTLASLFYKNNREAFHIALDRTIKYNNIILKRKIMLRSVELSKAASPLQRVQLLSPAFKAVMAGDLVQLKELERCNEDLVEPSSFGRRPIHLAASQNQLEILKFLIDKAENIDVRDDYGRTPSCFAVINSHEVILTTLIAKGVDINIIIQGASLLYHAIAVGREEIVKILLENKADANKPSRNGTIPASRAAEYGHIRILELLAAFDAVLIAYNHQGYSGAHRAAHNGHLPIFYTYAKLGIDFMPKNHQHEFIADLGKHLPYPENFVQQLCDDLGKKIPERLSSLKSLNDFIIKNKEDVLAKEEYKQCCHDIKQLDQYSRELMLANFPSTVFSQIKTAVADEYKKIENDIKLVPMRHQNYALSLRKKTDEIKREFVSRSDNISAMMLDFSLFKKYEDQYLDDNRHKDSAIREMYNRRFGLVLRQAGGCG